MDLNPYAAPGGEVDEPGQSANGIRIRHKQFLGKTFYFSPKATSLDELREKVRQQAEDFINMEIGVDNVISVSEHAMSLGPFTVVVWYRSKS